MSASQPTAVREPRPLASPLLSALFLAFSVLSLLRVALNNRLLDTVMDYTGDGGPIVAKIHPASWGLAVVAVVAALNYRIHLTAWERQVVRAILAVSAVAAAFLVIAPIRGYTGSTGYLVDDYVLLVVAIALFAFPPSWRRQLGLLLFAFLVASAVMGLIEFATRTHLLPYSESEAVFRPLGLANHPLAFGQWCVLAMCLACGLRQLGAARWALVALLAAALVVSGARTATIMGAVALFVYLVANVGADVGADQRRRLRLVIVLSTVIVVPILLAGLLAVGAFTRFQSGLADANGMSRLDIYSILGLMPWNEILLGGDIDRVRKLILEDFGYDSIESSLLVFVVQFGVVGAAILVGALGRLARALSRRADLSVVLAVSAFSVVALSNNALSAKSPDIFLLTVLGIAFHPARDEGMRAT